MQYDLLKFLSKLPDARRSQGKRHDQAAVLLMIIMAILSQHVGIRGYTRFMKANKNELIPLFNLKHGVPSHVTIGSILEGTSIEALLREFKQWMGQYIDIADNEFLSADGKTLGSTVSNPNNPMQDFVMMVSLFGQKTGLCYSIRPFSNGKSSESEHLKTLIQTFGLQGFIIDADALHAKKKH